MWSWMGCGCCGGGGPEIRLDKHFKRKSYADNPDLYLPMIDWNYDPYENLPIEKLREMKIPIPFLPLKENSMPTLVLDIDNTLVYTSHTKIDCFDYEIKIQFDGKETTLWIQKRPYLQHCLECLSRSYEVVAFSAGIREYGLKVLQCIDPEKKIRYFLDRRFCDIVGKNKKNHEIFTKNLNDLGRDLDRTIIVDDKEYSYFLSRKCGILLPGFFGSSEDRVLKLLTEHLTKILRLPSLHDRPEFLADANLNENSESE